MGIKEWFLAKGPGSPGKLTKGSCQTFKQFFDRDNTDQNSIEFRSYVSTLLYLHFAKYQSIEISPIHKEESNTELLLEKLIKLIGNSIFLYNLTYVFLYNINNYQLYEHHFYKAAWEELDRLIEAA